MPRSLLPSVILALFTCGAAAAEPLPATVDFHQHIRPILSDVCFQCHGPDEAQREAGLRLDMPAGEGLIVPGDPEASELYQRLTADSDMRMPPASSGRKLSQQQVALVRKWIEQGGKWGGHWSFEVPQRPALPRVEHSTWSAGAIDRFVLARLERQQLTPSPRASRRTLLRRVYLDLVGLPPTPGEVASLLADKSPDALERRVDRLLASPHFGERMAIPWLDAARYADTSGYQTDGVRYPWRWRDWVIDAYNRNLPFDQFTIEQLAGDLLENPTLDQLIATGFNRNHRANSEGGIVPEEYLIEYAVDRVDTTATVWLGLTLGCARCHDHKYDPITQREFYQLLAFFNNVPERGRVKKYDNSIPVVRAPTDLMQRELDELDGRIEMAEQSWRRLHVEAAQAQRTWERRLADREDHLERASSWHYSLDLAHRFPLDGNATDVVGGAKDDAAEGDVQWRPGRLGKAAAFSGGPCLKFDGPCQFAGDDQFTFAAWIRPRQTDAGALFSLMNDDDTRDQGFSVHLADGHIEVNFGPRWLDDAIRLRTEKRVAPDRWSHLAVTYDGSQWASGLKIYLDGEAQQTQTLLDTFTGTFSAKYPFRIGSRGVDGHFHGAVDELFYFTRQLEDEEVAVLSCSDPIIDIAKTTVKEREAAASAKIRACFLAEFADDRLQRAHEQLRDLRGKRRQALESLPTAMVMQDGGGMSHAYVLTRGEYDKPGEKVTPGTPDCLTSPAHGRPANRLDLARWLMSSSHPLTARVAVNRYWQHHFGFGLVRTPEDFGAQGEPPTHPDLLDWLAVEFADGWDVKSMQRRIVTSAAYCQSSRVTGELLQRDPDNRWLSRAPRLRLSAEIIRDNALAAAGLLSRKIGGPSVRPYQPAGLWKEIASDTYEQDSGEALYRRGMYTFWKRTVPPPTMATFDAGSREACVMRRSRTNTPLQALALLNDVTFVEAARSLAERMLTEAGGDDEDCLMYGFQRVLCRPPTLRERRVLLDGLKRQREHFRGKEDAARSYLQLGESRPAGDFDQARLAAFTTMASLMLNLDEAFVRE